MPRAKKTADVLVDRLDAMLVRLKLSGIRDQLDSLLDEVCVGGGRAAASADVR